MSNNPWYRPAAWNGWHMVQQFLVPSGGQAPPVIPVPHYAHPPRQIARPQDPRRDPSFLLGKMTDAERKAWNQLEESRANGASAERLHDLTQNAVDRSNSVKGLRREAYENGQTRER